MKTRKEYFGNTVILFSSQIYDGQICETSVCINGKIIMTIDGSQLENFIQDLNKLNGSGYFSS